MYYVNREQISVRLAVIPNLVQALQALESSWRGELLQGLAQERALHLAIETVTDVGSYLIDGFIMRDASSYEDIIEIIAGEQVFPDALKAGLLELVRLRRPLVQEYYEWDYAVLHPLVVQLPHELSSFKEAVESYLQKELGEQRA